MSDWPLPALERKPARIEWRNDYERHQVRTSRALHAMWALGHYLRQVGPAFEEYSCRLLNFMLVILRTQSPEEARATLADTAAVANELFLAVKMTVVAKAVKEHKMGSLVWSRLLQQPDPSNPGDYWGEKVPGPVYAARLMLMMRRGVGDEWAFVLIDHMIFLSEFISSQDNKDALAALAKRGLSEEAYKEQLASWMPISLE